MSPSVSVLLVSSDSALCERLTQELVDSAVVRCSPSLSEALTALKGIRWAAVVLDVDDEPSLEFWAALRATAPTTPTLVLLGSVHARVLNLAQRHRVEVLAKPAPFASVLGFLTRSLASAKGLTVDDVGAWTKVLTLRHSLTPAEADLFDHVLERETKEDVMARWAEPWPVVHEALLSMLRKCEARTAESLAKSVLVNAVLYRVDPDLAVQSMRLLQGHDDEDEAPCLRQA